MYLHGTHVFVCIVALSGIQRGDLSGYGRASGGDRGVGREQRGGASIVDHTAGCNRLRDAQLHVQGDAPEQPAVRHATTVAHSQTVH